MTGYEWRLRQVMASKGMWKTSELAPLLAERGVVLSAAQVYRLCAKVPERLSLRTLAALCDIFSCTPNDLIVTGTPTGPETASTEGGVVELRAAGRPKPARVARPPR
jgi:DNA-binding Xre family transcriptional regulator